MAKELRQANSPSDLAQRVSLPTRSSRLGAKRRSHDVPYVGFFSPSFLMRETNVLGLILSNSAAPPGP